MINRVSTSGIFLNDLSLLQRNQSRLGDLQYSLATGRKHQSLKFYGNDAPRILDLKNEIASREGYIRSINLTEGITASYDSVLDRLADVTTDLIDLTSPIDSSDPSFLTDTTVLANNFLLEIESNLNVRIGDRFIFAGTNFDTAPVNDLRNLGLYNETDIGTPNANETANTIPEFTIDSGGAATDQSYHSSWTASPTTDAAAWTSTSLTINDRQSLDYGITATDPAFQQLIEAVIRLKSAVATPGPGDLNGDGTTADERRTMLGEARTAAETARNSLRQLQSQNGAIIKQFDRSKSEHQNFVNISKTALQKVENADTTETAVLISALQTQLQASFTTISQRSQLSLVNFLR